MRQPLMRQWNKFMTAAAATAITTVSVIIVDVSSVSGAGVHHHEKETLAWQANDRSFQSAQASIKCPVKHQFELTRACVQSRPLLSLWGAKKHYFPLTRATTKCDAAQGMNESGFEGSTKKVMEADYYYQLLDPNSLFRTSLADSHAVFGALCGDGLIERYNVYRRVPIHPNGQRGPTNIDEKLVKSKTGQKSANSTSTWRMHEELTVVDLKLGHKLNGHGGIVHGGIISLIFDEAMGWAHECLDEQIAKKKAKKTQTQQSKYDTPKEPRAIVVTANLNVDFRAPLLEGSEAVVRVYHDGTEGRKIYFSAVLESLDGSVIFAEAKSLFIRVQKDRIKSKI